MKDIKLELRELIYLDKLIDCEVKQLEELKSLKVTIKGLGYTSDRVMTSNISTGFVELVDRIVDLEMKINSDIDKLVSKKDYFKGLFSSLDVDKRLLLTERYLNNKSWSEISKIMFCSLRKVYAIHGDALNDVRKLKELD